MKNHSDKWKEITADKHLTGKPVSSDLTAHLEIAAREYPQDISKARLEALQNEGYLTVTWKMNPGSGDESCATLNNLQWQIADFLSQTEHEAPIYSKSHVGCRCSIIIEGDGKDPIELWALQ